MPAIPFTIDAELLRNLGKAVGKPHIALAE